LGNEEAAMRRIFRAADRSGDGLYARAPIPYIIGQHIDGTRDDR